jgi:hypothetical protein
MTTRKDMSDDEWHWLNRIYRHDAAFLTVAMDKRLSELGVVEQRLGGAGVSALGKRLVETELLAIKKARQER